MNINKILSELFYKHDCIIIPEFGGFILNYENAKFEHETNTFYPPRKTISFNKRLNQNDGILINSLKDSENITYKKAKKIIGDYAENIHNKINVFKEYKFDDIGKIQLDKNNKLIFEEFKSSNFLNESYGLKSFKFYPIHDEIAININKQNIKNYKYLLRAAAIILPLIMIASFAIIQQNEIIHNMKKISSSSFIDLNSNNKEIIKKEYEVNKNNNFIYSNTCDLSNIINEASQRINKINSIKKDKNNHDIEYKFYVINGSFSKKKYAVRLNEKLKKQGFNSFIMGKDKRNRYKVCSFATNNKEKAKGNLLQLKKLNHKVWLLKI